MILRSYSTCIWCKSKISRCWPNNSFTIIEICSSHDIYF